MLEGLLVVGCEFFCGLDVLFGQRQHYLALKRYGVAHVAAVPRCQSCLAFGDGVAYVTGHQLVGVGAAFVYLQSRVPAFQALQRHLYGCVVRVGVGLFVFQCGCYVESSGAADDKLSPSLRVEVEQYVAVEFALGQVVGTVHAGFLVGRYQCLHRSVLQFLVFHYGHDGCHADAVVRAERGSACLHPVAVDVCLNGIRLEVVRAFLRLLGHHVHVRLQYHAFAPLHSRGCGLAHHNVSGRVLKGFDANLCGEVEQEVLYFLKMS